MSAGPGQLHRRRRRLGGRALRGRAPGRCGRATPPRISTSSSPREEKDPIPNLFHRFEEQDNQDELYVVYFFHKWSGQWISLCPYNAADQERVGDGDPRRIRATRTSSSSPARRPASRRSARATGATARGPRRRPGCSTRRQRRAGRLGAADVPAQALLRRLHRRRARRVLPGRPELHQERHAGRPVRHAADHLAERDREPVQRVERRFAVDDGAGVLHLAGSEPAAADRIKDSALQRTRYRELSPVGECGNFAFIDRLEHDHIEDGRWASPLTNTPRLQVFSPTYCTHNEYEAGRRAAVGLQPVHDAGLQDDAGVLRRRADAAAGRPPARRRRRTVCQDGGVQWPAGKVWPRDVPTDDKSIYPTYLFGPQGAVLRADGVSGSGSSATISGWACDPEWAGASVAVAVYGGAPRDQGGTLLGRGARRPGAGDAAGARGERGLRRPGPHRTRATGSRSRCRRTRPATSSSTRSTRARPNGPAAPPTLIRNGIVHVPALRAQRARRGRGAVRELQRLRDQRLRRRIARRLLHDGVDRRVRRGGREPARRPTAPRRRTAASFAAVTTGWIEAPVDAATTSSRRRSSRAGCSSTAPRCSTGSRPRRARPADRSRCPRGQKYHLRWDRFQAEPPVGHARARA